MPFDSGRKAGSERHNTMDAAFAVPATHRGRRASSEADVRIPVVNARPPSKIPQSPRFFRAGPADTVRHR